MSHKEEAVKFLVDALSDQTSKSPAGYDAATMMISHAQAHATLALVEAQERANELKRVEILVMLAGNNEAGQAADQATKTLCWRDPSTTLRPEIARALGIGGAE